tara:strand:+ start:99 stop:638 length:540 start_codon:yes stop_codon:yes gene_type:complete
VKKSEIRKRILKKRKLKSYKNLQINFKYLIGILKKKKIVGKIVGGYYPYNYELDSIEILKKFEKKNYQITLPKIRNNSQMDFFNWSLNDPLIINKYGIPEPISNKVRFPNILLVPVVAFDDKMNRVGYGGGYYDRYIKKIKKKFKIITIGLAYSYQRVNKILTNKHDIRLDFIITEKNN